MAIERATAASLIDVLDRVLDKGIVVDAWVRVSLVGIDLLTVEARIVVASIETYLKYTDEIRMVGLVAAPEMRREPRPAPAESSSSEGESLQARFRSVAASNSNR